MGAMEHGKGWSFAEAMCKRRWGLDGQMGNIEDPVIIENIAQKVGLDGRACIQAARSTQYNAQLAAWKDDAIRDQVFGFPFFTYKGQKYWGNDRLPWLLKDVQGLAPTEPLPPLTTGRQ